METLKNDEVSSEDYRNIVKENQRLRKEIFFLRLFTVGLILIQLYNIFHK